MTQRSSRALFALGARVASCCIVWFGSSIAIIYTNKYYLSVRDFCFPLTVNYCTNTGTYLIALALKPCTPAPASRDLRLSIAIGVITALDIGASNAGLTLLSVSFHTVIRGAIPGLVLIFALIAGLEQPQWVTMASVLCVCLGIVLATLSQTAFSLPGFLLVAAACVFSALRWVLVQQLVQPQQQSGMEGAPAMGTSPVATILQTSPSSIATTVPLALWFELAPLREAPFWRQHEVLRELGVYLLVVSLLVFLLMYSEYKLVQLTSSLSLSVAGILKELLCILGAIVLFHDTFTPLNTVGFCLCAVGILVYNVHKVSRLRVEMRAHTPAQGTGLCTAAEGMPSPKEAEDAWGVGDHEAMELLSPAAVGSSPKSPKPFPSSKLGT